MPVIGKVKASKLNDDHFQTILDKAFAAGKSKKTLSNINNTAKNFARFCRRKGATSYIPDDVKIPKGARLKGKKCLQPQDLITLFKSDSTTFRGEIIADPYIHAYRFLVLVGIRPGELYGLKRSDRSGNRLRILRSINEVGEITEGKNENAIRGFVLTPSAAEEWDAQVKLNPWGEYLFYEGHPKGLLRYWKRYCEHNDIAYVSLYELRHTFISIVKSLPEGWLKSIVGHTKDMDTFGVYGHWVVGEDQKIADRIEDIFKDILCS